MFVFIGILGIGCFFPFVVVSEVLFLVVLSLFLVVVNLKLVSLDWCSGCSAFSTGFSWVLLFGGGFFGFSLFSS